ncbi:cytochrome P450 2K1-like isoform X3 [Archocentrus centrarchus]|uniref:cytochrome P450 2K1-like isoform X3 n=1 Tax=Archocentrus centrarchus TaxID=63155 RepID=UPI0011EA4D4F|nr:cytochrome P450 2K1-like isoform X3 [Archocentrus centrarchus]
MGILDIFLQCFSSAFLLWALTVLLLIYLISSSSFSTKNNGKEPPGPRSFPVLGNLLQLDLKKPYHTLLELSKKYGSVFTIHLGPQKVVVLAGYKTVKEALGTYDDVFGDRNPMRIVHEMAHGHGVVWSNGDSWKEMRRFALTNLRDFGMGKRACEDKITEECQHLIEVFKKFKGEAFDTTQSLSYAVSNIICSIVYGSRFEYNDPEFTSSVNRISRGGKLLGSPSIQESGTTNSHFHTDNLLMTVIQLFAAGTETTSTTLRWALLFMAKYPKIQDEVQEELRRVIGDRQVQVADRKNLPFTDAVIHETQRLSSIVPTALPHKTTRDITFHGHFIEKGTTVFPLLTSVLHDPDEWERPHSFYPAHFLDKEKKFVKRDAFIPFSAGRRVCLGEGLARMELFLFFATLLQHFRFTPAPEVSEDELDLTPSVGLTLSPSPHRLCAVSCM